MLVVSGKPVELGKSVYCAFDAILLIQPARGLRQSEDRETDDQREHNRDDQR